jgi:hypothetical protein
VLKPLYAARMEPAEQRPPADATRDEAGGPSAPTRPGSAMGWLVAGLGGFMAGIFVLVLLIQTLDPAAMDGGSWMGSAGAAAAIGLWCAAAGWGLYRAQAREASVVSGILRIVSGVATFGAGIAVLIWAAGLPGPGADPAAGQELPGLAAGSSAALIAAAALALVAGAAALGRWRLLGRP